MIEFKAVADRIIKERWGIEVEHICAMRKDGTKQTYEKVFYRIPKRKPGGKFVENSFAGFPYQKGGWCNDRLKTNPLDTISHTTPPAGENVNGFPIRKGQWCTSSLKTTAIQKTSAHPLSSVGIPEAVVQYVGIAIDEPERLERLDGITKVSPLAAIGWTERDCREWCEENKLLSPIYTTATRGGCWFCHNQSVDQLRFLRHNYPELWRLLLRWDNDSPVTFKPPSKKGQPGHTIHDYDLRFELEDNGKVPTDRRFRWKMMNEVA